MEPRGSMPYLQGLSNKPYPETNKVISSYLIKIHFIIEGQITEVKGVGRRKPQRFEIRRITFDRLKVHGWLTFTEVKIRHFNRNIKYTVNFQAGNL